MNYKTKSKHIWYNMKIFKLSVLLCLSCSIGLVSCEKDPILDNLIENSVKTEKDSCANINDNNDNNNGNSNDELELKHKVTASMTCTSIVLNVYNPYDMQETKVRVNRIGDVNGSTTSTWRQNEFYKYTFGGLEIDYTYEFKIEYLNDDNNVLYTKIEKFKTLALELPSSSYIFVYDNKGRREECYPLRSATEKLKLYNQSIYQSAWYYEKSLVFRGNEDSDYIGFYLDSPYYDGYPIPSAWDITTYSIAGSLGEVPYYQVSCFCRFKYLYTSGAWSGTLVKGTMSQGKCYYHFEGKCDGSFEILYYKLHFVEDF